MWAEQISSLASLTHRLGQTPLARWLTPGERERLASIRSSQRALQWLGGRWLGKQLMLQQANDPQLSPLDLHIESRNAHDQGARPSIFRQGRLQSWQLSISHSRHTVYAAVSTDSRVRLGVDVTARQHLPDGFFRFWMTSAEQHWCRPDRDRAGCILWSLKESWYKAAAGDQPFAPRQLDMVAELSLDELPTSVPTCDRPWDVSNDSGRTIRCRWLPHEVATLVLLRTVPHSMSACA